MPEMQTKRDIKSARAAAAQAAVPTLEPEAIDSLAAILAQYTTFGHHFDKMMIGPAMANAMLARNFDNRPIRKAKASMVARAMTEGRWKDTPECAKFDIKGVLRDGQHRLLAIVMSGATVPMTVCFGCDPSERDFYDQGTARSVADIAREHGHQNVRHAQALVALILRIEMKEFISLDRTLHTQRLDELYAEDSEFELAIRAAMRLNSFAPPAAAALAFWTIATHTAKRDKVDAFWDALATGANLDDRSPVLRVRDVLRGIAHSRRNTRDTSVRIAAAIIIAWNAYLIRRHTRSFKWGFSVALPEVS